jgi:hypothetical protein
MDKNWKISHIGFAQSKQLWKSKSLALALIPTENQIFMACLDAHLYEIEYINAVQKSKNHCGANYLSVTVIRLIGNRKCREKCVLFAPQWFFDHWTAFIWFKDNVFIILRIITNTLMIFSNVFTIHSLVDADNP